MKKMRFAATILIICMLLSAVSVAAYADDLCPEGIAPPELELGAAIVGDTETGRILYSRNADAPMAPASLTKLMSVLLVIEAVERGDIALTDMVTAQSDCRDGIPAEGNPVLSAGEVISVNDLLYSALLISSNEAVNILGTYLTGSVDSFVNLMNTRAAELGCTGTCFKNANGLDADGHVSTAHDLFIISCEALRHELFVQISGTASYTAAATNIHPERVLQNTNAFLNEQSVYGSDELFGSVYAGKTGHTGEAGFCLMAAARQENENYAAIVLNADGSITDGKYGHFDAARTLLNWAFDNFEYRCIMEKGTKISTMPVTNGVKKSVAIVTAQDIYAVAPVGTEFNPQSGFELEYSSVAAPVSEGDILGTLTLSDSGGTVGTCALCAKSGVKIQYTDAQLEQQQEAETLSAYQQLAPIVISSLCVILLLLFALSLLLRGKKKSKENKK